MSEIEQRIRESLTRTAGQAPTLDEVVERVSSGNVASRTTTRPRWRMTLTVVAAAAAVAVIVGAIAIYGPMNKSTSTSPPPGLLGAATVNPSHRPNIELCDSLAREVGADAVLLRAVTVPTGTFETWLARLPGWQPSLNKYGLSAAAPTTTICAYSTSKVPVVALPNALSAGATLYAQSRDRFASGEKADVTTLLNSLNPLQHAILKRLENRQIRGIDLAPWGQPCRGGRATNMEKLADHPYGVRLPDTPLANADNLKSAWMCGDTPELMYPTVQISFETGWPRRDWSTIWQGLLKQQPGWNTTTFGNPTLVLHPVDGSYGEVMYIENGILMRVLGDGSIPAEQLLNIVRSSRPLTNHK